MYFQFPTPDTSAYMVAGYAIFFLVTVIYLISLFVRWRNLQRDLQTLDEMEKER